ncbi:MAG: PD-(D/E)XK nuclease family protein [Bacteroidota bacterium]
MTIHFGLDFDGNVHPTTAPDAAGNLYAGPHRLLQWLEHQLGLSGFPNNTEYLRIELYRQTLGALLETDTSVFYKNSFNSDRFATAAVLLERRDELLLSGWNFEQFPEMPPRLATFSALETAFQIKKNDPEIGAAAWGWADRFELAIERLQNNTLPLAAFYLYEPENLQPPFVTRFVQILKAKQIPVKYMTLAPAAPENTALGFLQRRICAEASISVRSEIPFDGSLLILRARRDSDAAVAIAQILKQNPDFKPLFLLPELNLMLEQSLILEGLPALGVLSASLARPSLQVLKLAPAFLWEPVDVFKIMEFVTLPVKPFDDGLALEIARVLAEKPGLFSDTWFAAVYGYLERPEVEKSAATHYEFWFNRRRYRADTTAPKRDAVELYKYLQNWARDFFETSGRKNSSLLVLAEQARRIHDLLEALPEQRIGFLELERIVRTIYDPSPVQMTTATVGAYAYLQKAGALAAPAENVLWWNCLFEQTAPSPDRWQARERQWLKTQGVALMEPVQEGQLNILRQQKPVLQSASRLILVVPEQADGKESVPNLLLGDMESAFSRHREFTFSLDDPQDRRRLSESLQTPVFTQIEPRVSGRPKPQLMLKRPDLLADSAYETPTNLESLFYYPHRWFFRQKAKLYPSNLLSVTADTTLLGNLAHRFFELLLKEDTLPTIDKNGVHHWIDEKAGYLLEREGATLLLYGREPERNAFLNKVKNAAWSLISLIRDNNWSVLHTEYSLEGSFLGVPVRGKADLVLQRGQEHAIVDLKWSGARRRKELIQNGEDLQLTLYAHLFPPTDQWPHTAYFILEDGKMIARNRAAFADAIVAGKGDEGHTEACARTLAKMERTFNWRLEQVRKGIIELRTARTASELEALYEGELLDLLEMKLEDARWDDYATLLAFM